MTFLGRHHCSGEASSFFSYWKVKFHFIWKLLEQKPSGFPTKLLTGSSGSSWINAAPVTEDAFILQIFQTDLQGQESRSHCTITSRLSWTEFGALADLESGHVGGQIGFAIVVTHMEHQNPVSAVVDSRRSMKCINVDTCQQGPQSASRLKLSLCATVEAGYCQDSYSWCFKLQ